VAEGEKADFLHDSKILNGGAPKLGTRRRNFTPERWKSLSPFPSPWISPFSRFAAMPNRSASLPGRNSGTRQKEFFWQGI
jgi:hypothetical protein